MSLKPYKFLVTPICQNVDDSGNVCSEQMLSQDNQNQPVVVFGIQQLTDFAAGFQAVIDQINQPEPAAPEPKTLKK